jgi:hypothetical protein
MKTAVALFLLAQTALAEQVSPENIDGNKTTMRMLASTAACIAKEDRQTAMEKLANEKKYERQTGVVRLGYRNALRSQLETADREKTAAMAFLKAANATPLPCTNEYVSALDLCIRDQDRDPLCKASGAQAFIAWIYAKELLEPDDE